MFTFPTTLGWIMLSFPWGWGMLISRRSWKNLGNMESMRERLLRLHIGGSSNKLLPLEFQWKPLEAQYIQWEWLLIGIRRKDYGKDIPEGLTAHGFLKLIMKLLGEDFQIFRRNSADKEDKREEAGCQGRLWNKDGKK